MSKTVTETKDTGINFDYSNTCAYKTVKAYNKEGVFHSPDEDNAPGTPDIPHEEYGQLKYLRKLDLKIRKDKGPILKKITHMHRKVVNDFDQYGKKISKEFLYFGGEFRGITWNGEEDARSFIEGYYKKPIIRKVYEFGKKFDPETGEDLGKMKISGSKLEYYYEVPKSKAERIKFINSFIDNSPGTFADQILYYFESTDDDPMARSDATFSALEFTELSYKELKNLSYKGGGAKTPGYYRTPDGKLRTQEGNIIDE